MRDVLKLTKFFKKGNFFKKWTFHQNYKLFQKYWLFSKNFFHFQNLWIFLIFLHIFNIFYKQRNPSKTFNWIFFYFKSRMDKVAFQKIIFLRATAFVRKSFPHNLLKGGIWPADHDGTISFPSNRPVRSLQAFLYQNYDVTEHHENRTLGAPGNGHSNATHIWSHRRVAREFSRNN